MKDLFIYNSKLKTTKEKNLIFVAGSNPSIAEFIDKKLGRRGVVLVALLDFEKSTDKVIISVPTVKVGDEIRPICKTMATVGEDGELTLEGSFLLDVSNMEDDTELAFAKGVFSKKVPIFVKMYDFGDSNLYNAVSSDVTSHQLMAENTKQEKTGFISKAKTYQIEGEFELSDIILNEQFMKHMEFPKLNFDDVYMELEESEESSDFGPGKAVIVTDSVNKYNKFSIEDYSFGIVVSRDKDLIKVFVPAGSSMGDIEIFAKEEHLKNADKIEIDTAVEEEDSRETIAEFLSENSLPDYYGFLSVSRQGFNKDIKRVIVNSEEGQDGLTLVSFPKNGELQGDKIEVVNGTVLELVDNVVTTSFETKIDEEPFDFVARKYISLKDNKTGNIYPISNEWKYEFNKEWFIGNDYSYLLENSPKVKNIKDSQILNQK